MELRSIDPISRCGYALVIREGNVYDDDKIILGSLAILNAWKCKTGGSVSKLFIFSLCFGLSSYTALSVNAQDQTKANIKYAAKFDYTPAAPAATLAHKITFTVASVGYKPVGQIAWFTFEQFKALDDSIKQDLSEVLSSKGFSVRGPYQSYDLIPFQDKKDIDFLVSITLAPTVDLKEIKERLQSRWGWRSATLQTGNADVSGTNILELREIITKELMWTKTIPIKSFSYPFTVSIPWGKPYSPGKIYDFNPIIDGMAKGLEQQYADIMATLYTLIDSEEMAIVQKQAQEFKSKKGY